MAQALKGTSLHTLSGKVVCGRELGKIVGAPTANLQIVSQDELPPTGVYATEILLKSKLYYGVSNIGTRPTVDDDSSITIETFIFNFRKDIYGQGMEIRLYQKLRDQKKFDSLSLLLDQIQKDCVAAQEFFGIEQIAPRLNMDIEKHTATIDGRQLYLTRKEFDILYLLYANPDVAFSKEQIYETVWHEISGGQYHAVENTVFQIRKKFKALAAGVEFIKTIAGYGYQFQCSEEA